MISSKPKAAYVANGAELEFPFEDNALLAKKDEQPFEDPPGAFSIRTCPLSRWQSSKRGSTYGWRGVKRRFRRNLGEQADATAELDEGSTETAPSDETAVEGDGTEWAEIGVPEPIVAGVPEEEVEARVAAARAEAQVSLACRFCT